MTTEEWIKDQQKKIAELMKYCKPLEIAAKDTMAMQAGRIFVEGKDSADSSIGKYSTKPFYLNPKHSPKKFSTKGKTGQTKFKTGVKKGQAHATRYFADGYKGFRNLIGRQTKFVDLSLVGDLQSDFANSPAITKNLPKNIKPIKVSYLEYITALKRGINKEKRDGLEAKYGPLFKLTQNEIKNFNEIIKKETDLLFGA